MRTRKKGKKKILINSKLRLDEMITFCTLLIIMLGLTTYFSTKGKYTEQKVAQYSYLNKAKVNYQVFLTPNSLYPPEQKSIGEGNLYIRKLTDYIEAILKYEFNGDRQAELQGSYSAKAVMEGKLGDEKAKKTIWKYEEQLIKQQNFKVSSDKHVIELKSNIDQKHFEKIANAKSEESGLNFETSLTIYWDIQTEIKTDKGTAHEQLNPTMVIPINTNSYFEISGDLTPQKKGAIENNVKIVSPSYKKNLITCSGTALISLFILLFILAYTANKPDDSLLQIKLKKIFKNHGDRLVRLANEDLIDMVKQVHVKDFEDLVRVADDIGRPIFYKDSKDMDEISTFYVFDSNYVYILHLNETDQAAVTLDKDLEAPVDPSFS